MIWKDYVFFAIQKKCENRLLEQLLDMVRKDRDGDFISRNIIQKAIASLSN